MVEPSLLPVLGLRVSGIAAGQSLPSGAAPLAGLQLVLALEALSFQPMEWLLTLMCLW